MPLPRQTLADLVIAADIVAFGQLDPEQPFAFVAEQIVKGQVTDRHVDLFADSTTRRQLAADSNRHVLLVKSREGWQNLGVVDAEFEQIVRRILLFAAEWNRADGAARRLEYFLSLWNPDHRSQFELAYLELGKAPYAAIRQFGRQIAFEDLQPLLTRRDYLEWRALAILMVAQRDDPASQQLITDGFAQCTRYGTTANLAAWATGYVEVHRSAGVDVIEQEYFRNPGRTEVEIRGVLAALSVQARQNDVKLRERIVVGYGSALSVHPQVAGLVVRDLADWNESRYAQEIGLILANPELKFDEGERMRLERYARAAGD
ncbi:MAG: hypothetical protein JSS02_21060 [Planctomycetes bacterium]|nr:hypothetical protein [Planctomycetota bacterium]